MNLIELLFRMQCMDASQRSEEYAAVGVDTILADAIESCFNEDNRLVGIDLGEGFVQTYGVTGEGVVFP